MLNLAVFFDRDGTLIVNRHYLADPAGVELQPGAREVLQVLLAEGCKLFLFTNQSGVGRGLFTIEAVHRCNQRMLELLDLPGPGFTDVCIATETPEQPAVYRKPSPRFIQEMLTKHSLAAATTWMVGDSLADVQAGLNAGVRAAILAPEEIHGLPSSVMRCRDLRDFLSKLEEDQA